MAGKDIETEAAMAKRVRSQDENHERDRRRGELRSLDRDAQNPVPVATPEENQEDVKG